MVNPPYFKWEASSNSGGLPADEKKMQIIHILCYEIRLALFVHICDCDFFTVHMNTVFMGSFHILPSRQEFQRMMDVNLGFLVTRKLDACMSDV